ncbi:MAG: ComF family protein [bacterium]|nr:ComF family protein [bacterium]
MKALKYRHVKVVVPELAALMEAALAQRHVSTPAVLVPVPLHPRRLSERGHNQALLLAAAISRNTGMPLTDRLIRTRYTQTQTGLGRRQRRRNVRGAFRWSGPALRSRAIILVDDVVTTTATLDACAAACRKAGAREVWGLVAAMRCR